MSDDGGSRSDVDNLAPRQRSLSSGSEAEEREDHLGAFSDDDAGAHSDDALSDDALSDAHSDDAGDALSDAHSDGALSDAHSDDALSVANSDDLIEGDDSYSDALGHGHSDADALHDSDTFGRHETFGDSSDALGGHDDALHHGGDALEHDDALRLAGHMGQMLLEKNEEAESRINDLEEELAALRRQMDEAHDNEETWKTRARRAEMKASDIEEKHKKAKERFGVIRSEFEKLREAQKRKNERDAMRQQQQRVLAEKTDDTLSSESKALREKIDRLEAELKEGDELKKLLKASRDSLKQELEALRVSRLAKVDLSVELQQTFDDKRSDLEEKLRKLEVENDDLSRESEKMTLSAMHYQKKYDESVRLLKSTQAELDSLQKLPRESPASPIGAMPMPMPAGTKPVRSSSLMDQLQSVKFESNSNSSSTSSSAPLQGEVSPKVSASREEEKAPEAKKEKEPEKDMGGPRLLRADANKEFFYLTCLALKMKLSDTLSETPGSSGRPPSSASAAVFEGVDQKDGGQFSDAMRQAVLSVRPKELFEVASAQDLEFYEFYDWLLHHLQEKREAVLSERADGFIDALGAQHPEFPAFYDWLILQLQEKARLAIEQKRVESKGPSRKRAPAKAKAKRKPPPPPPPARSSASSSNSKRSPRPLLSVSTKQPKQPDDPPPQEDPLQSVDRVIRSLMPADDNCGKLSFIQRQREFAGISLSDVRKAVHKFNDLPTMGADGASEEEVARQGVRLLMSVERCLTYGIKRGVGSFFGFDKTFWDLIVQTTERSQEATLTALLAAVKGVAGVRAGVGKGRVWLRRALNEKKLAHYLEIVLGSEATRSFVRSFYEDYAMVVHHAGAFVTLLEHLDADIEVQLPLHDQRLDMPEMWKLTSDGFPRRRKDLYVFYPVLHHPNAAHPNSASSAQGGATLVSTGGDGSAPPSRKRHRRKKSTKLWVKRDPSQAAADGEQLVIAEGDAEVASASGKQTKPPTEDAVSRGETPVAAEKSAGSAEDGAGAAAVAGAVAGDLTVTANPSPLFTTRRSSKLKQWVPRPQRAMRPKARTLKAPIKFKPVISDLEPATLPSHTLKSEESHQLSRSGRVGVGAGGNRSGRVGVKTHQRSASAQGVHNFVRVRTKAAAAAADAEATPKANSSVLDDMFSSFEGMLSSTFGAPTPRGK